VPRPTATAARRRRSFFPCWHDPSDASPREQAHPAFPVTIYYAFSNQRATVSRHCKHRLGNLPSNAVIPCWFRDYRTWPMRTELGNRIRANGLQRPCLKHHPRLSSRASNAPPHAPRVPYAAQGRAGPTHHHLQHGTSRRWIWRKRLSAPVWRSLLVTLGCLDAEGKPLPCAQR